MMIAWLAVAALPKLNPLIIRTSTLDQLHRSPDLVLGVLLLSLAIAFVSLWLTARDFLVFRILGIYYGLLGCELFSEYAGADPLDWTLRAFAVVAIVEVAGQALNIRKIGWTRLFWPFYFLVILGAWIPSLAGFRDLALVSEVPLAVLIYQGFRYGNRRDRMIAAAFALHFAVRITVVPVARRFTGWTNLILIGDWQWKRTALTLTILGVTTLAVFVRALIQDRRDKLRLVTELSAARVIQQVLIPEVVPMVPGFEVRSVYRPFGEVGGDFFQIVPLNEGRALIAIGDVSGKGLPAAMQVSLLVGTLRAVAEYTDSPAAMLAALNRHMMGRSNGGFTTCLLLRADADGQLVVANAGHIAPYCNGTEVKVENGLPLGLAANAEYEESAFTLSSHDQLTLTTDGIVEARSKTGELYGFERAAAISRHSAEDIADAAQAFGQDDDITVLTLTMLPSGAADA
jgi:hypothetical protein